MADAAPVKAESINLTVRDQTGGEVQFKVKPTTKFSKVRERKLCSKPRQRYAGSCKHGTWLQILTAYCEKKALNAMSVR